MHVTFLLSTGNPRPLSGLFWTFGDVSRPSGALSTTLYGFHIITTLTDWSKFALSWLVSLEGLAEVTGHSV